MVLHATSCPVLVGNSEKQCDGNVCRWTQEAMEVLHLVPVLSWFGKSRNHYGTKKGTADPQDTSQHSCSVRSWFGNASKHHVQNRNLQQGT